MIQNILNNHERILNDILKKSIESPIYKELIEGKPFDKIPVQGYNHITKKLESLGSENCLLKKEDFFLLTSGSTDKPKKLYYTWNDIRRSASIYHDLLSYIGFKDEDSGWEMSAWIPFMSGPLSRSIMETFDTTGEIVFSPIEDQNDIIKAYRKISKGKYRFDILSMPVLFYFILSQLLNNPTFTKDVVKKSLSDLPSPIVNTLAKILGRGIRPDIIRESISGARFIVCSAAAMEPYMKILDSMFPIAEKIDLWASTENACMGLRPPGAFGHYLLIEEIIPEIIPSEESIKMSEDETYIPRTIMMKDWETGMRGELVITRDGDCLPLIRYRTGDEIEILKPFEDDVEWGPFQGKPLVRLLGRTADKIDFFDPEQWGPYHGDEIHFSDIENVLGKDNDIKWWELYATRELPRRLVLVVIAEREVVNLDKRVLKVLLEEVDKSTMVFSIANLLGELDIEILGPGSFDAIQDEIDRLSKERGASRVKPRRMFILRNYEEIERRLSEKYNI